MKQALVIGASGGIGRALCAAIGADGWQVTGLSRSQEGLDVTDERSVAHHLGQLEGRFELIFVATGALEIGNHGPEKALGQMSRAGFEAQFALNAIGPALVLAHAPRLLPRDRRGVFAALSARVGSIKDNRLGGWYSYRASKAALNQIIKTGAIELARSHPKAACVALHPGTVQTEFTRKYLGRHPAVAPIDAAQNLLAVVGGLTPGQSGGFFDWAGKPVDY